MRNFESGSFDFYSNREKPSGGERERASELDDIDLRPESEVFQDHERIDSKDLDDQLIALRDQLSKDTGGIIHIDIPAYRYILPTILSLAWGRIAPRLTRFRAMWI